MQDAVLCTVTNLEKGVCITNVTFVMHTVLSRSLICLLNNNIRLSQGQLKTDIEFFLPIQNLLFKQCISKGKYKFTSV